MPLMGCAPDLDAEDYEVASVGQVSTSQEGTLIFKRNIKMHYYERGPVSEGATSGATGGALAGGLAGAAAGSSPSAVAGGALLGAALGAGLGYGVESSTRTHPGVEYHIKLNGTKENIVVTQGVKPEIPVGSKVFVITPKKMGIITIAP